MSNIRNWFSNMLPLDEPFILGGVSYRTSEHYYQARKCANEEDMKLVAAMGPHEAKRALNSGKIAIREDWDEELKIHVMWTILNIKFAPGTSWHDKLIETGNSEIVEVNDWKDVFWGYDINLQRGRNMLGKMLMEIRDHYAGDPFDEFLS